MYALIQGGISAVISVEPRKREVILVGGTNGVSPRRDRGWLFDAGSLFYRHDQVMLSSSHYWVPEYGVAHRGVRTYVVFRWRGLRQKKPSHDNDGENR
jgi:hypothetical protein